MFSVVSKTALDTSTLSLLDCPDEPDFELTMTSSTHNLNATVANVWVDAIFTQLRHYQVDTQAVSQWLAQQDWSGRSAQGIAEHWQQCAKPGHRWPLDTVVEIWQAAIVLSADPLFGLKMGSQFKPNQLQLLNHIWSSCANLGQVLTLILPRQALLSSGGRLSVQYRAAPGQASVEWVQLNYQPQAARIAFSVQQVDAVLAMVSHLLQLSMPSDFALTAVSFCQPSHHLAEYQAQFQCPVHFASASNSLCFAKHWLTHPFASSDPELLALSVEKADRLLRSTDAPSLDERIRQWLVVNQRFNNLSKTEVAALLNVSARTLQRHLEKLGFSFEQLKDQTRAQLQQQLQQLPVEQQIEQLGFADVSSYYKAKRRWRNPGS